MKITWSKNEVLFKQECWLPATRISWNPSPACYSLPGTSLAKDQLLPQLHFPYRSRRANLADGPQDHQRRNCSCTSSRGHQRSLQRKSCNQVLASCSNLSLYASKANIFITYVFRRTLLDIHTSLTLWELTWAYQILQVHSLFWVCACFWLNGFYRSVHALLTQSLLALRNRINDSVQACVASIYMHYS